eukprot:6152162-Prymnesium_polylepis.1
MAHVPEDARTNDTERGYPHVISIPFLAACHMPARKDAQLQAPALTHVCVCVTGRRDEARGRGT